MQGADQCLVLSVAMTAALLITVLSAEDILDDDSLYRVMGYDVDWDDPASYLGKFAEIECEELCEMCNYIPSSIPKVECWVHCDGVCDIPVELNEEDEDEE